MALKFTLDTLEGVDDKYHDLYTENDGKFVFSGVEGVKSQEDVNRLTSALTKERNDHKSVKDRLGLLGDRKIEDVLAQLDRIPELEAAAEGKLDDDKLNNIVESRIKTKLSPIERERDQLKARVTELETVNGELTQREITRGLHDIIRKEGGTQKVLPEAMEDALMLAERVFERTEDGQYVVKDNVGFTPGLEAGAWLTDLQSKRPHWWGPSSGGGAGGQRGGGGSGGPNPWSAEGWNMTEQGKILKADRSRAEQLAKAAGTSIGGQKPAPKK